MSTSLWGAAALGLLGPPVFFATLASGMIVAAFLLERREVADKVRVRLGLSPLSESERQGNLFGRMGLAVGLGLLLSAGVPGAVAWRVWMDTAHTALAAASGAATLAVLYLVMAWSTRL